MSETQTNCPFCGRLPGYIHHDRCPRSRARQRALAAESRERLQPRLLWAKGLILARPRGKKRSFMVLNPGVPYTRPVPGLSISRGGVPAGKAKEVEEFFYAIGVVR